MFSPTIMSNSTPLSDQATIFSNIHHSPQKLKKKRSLPGNPDPDAEVIALSPTTLLATNRFVCEICNKGFQRDQNLQLHRRGHKLPWKLKQRSSKEVKKKAYVCPEEGCVHHNPSRALGDLTGIKKHYSRKHGEKKWKCLKCSKLYAVQSDWKAHSKTCGTREYRCDCGTLFSRKDRFVTHRAFCDALAEESARLSTNQLAIASAASGATGVDVSLSSTMVAQSLFHSGNHYQFSNSLIPSSPSSLSLSSSQTLVSLNPWNHPLNPNPNHTLQMIKPEDSNSHHFHQIPNLPLSDDSNNNNYHPFGLIQDHHHKASSSSSSSSSSMITSPFRNLHVSVQPASHAATSAHLSATALLQKAATVGVGVGAAKSGHHQPESVGHITHFNIPEFRSSNHISSLSQLGPDYATWQKSDRLTRDFLGLTGHGSGSGSGGAVHVSMIVKDMLTYADGIEMFKPHNNNNNNNNNSNGFGYGEADANGTWGDC